METWEQGDVAWRANKSHDFRPEDRRSSPVRNRKLTSFPQTSQSSFGA